MDVTDTTSFLTSYRLLIDSHLQSIYDLLTDTNISSVCTEYNVSKNVQHQKSLNVFSLVSDLYYRENFHSDIICEFLNPAGSHNEGTAFLFAFIDFINTSFLTLPSISKKNYLSAKAEREYENIDILISDDVSKHCIIFENKINNAVDMPRQLPRYYDTMTHKGFTVDAIVYLPLMPDKSPDMSSWSANDRDHILPLLCIVPAYQKASPNLVDGWILLCTKMTKNPDCAAILRQYAELIRKLNDNIMDNFILSKFYQSLIENKNIETAISVKNMLLDLPVYMAERLYKRYKPLENGYKVWIYKPNFCGILFQLGECQYKVDIWTREDGYSVHVFGQVQSERKTEWAKNMKSLESFVFSNNEYHKTDFSFYDEEKVIQCVDAVIKEMQGILFPDQGTQQ